jgi:hypothetical protein
MGVGEVIAVKRESWATLNAKDGYATIAIARPLNAFLPLIEVDIVEPIAGEVGVALGVDDERTRGRLVAVEEKS